MREKHQRDRLDHQTAPRKQQEEDRTALDHFRAGPTGEGRVATQENIRQWVYEAQASGAKQVLIVSDRFDFVDYPVSVHEGEDALEIARCRYDWGHPESGNLCEVRECYDLRRDIESQLQERRALHW